MFSYEVYRVVHFSGLFALVLALGAITLHIIQGGTKQDFKAKKLVMATHGTGLLISLVGGFGLLARLGLTGGLPGWVYLKLAIWLGLGMSPILLYKRPQTAKAVWFILIVLFISAAYTARYKPF